MKSHARRIVEAEFFTGHAVQLKWDTSQQGIDGTVALGGRAGPEVSIVNLCHEMAHFVEIDDARCVTEGWGLIVPQQFVYDRMCCNPVTHQGTDREIRVAAYQYHLLQYLGIYRTPAYLVSSFHFLPDFCFVPKARCAYTGPSWKSPGTMKRLQWCANKLSKLIIRPKYQIEKFKDEWWRKHCVLRKKNP